MAQTTSKGAVQEEQRSTSANLPADESAANHLMSDRDANKALREQNIELVKDIKVEANEDTDPTPAPTKVTVNGMPVNPSSTYPGRDQELAENDGQLPSVIDLARRAKFAGSQIPEVVFAAGLVGADGEINVDMPDSAEDDASDDE